ncbi:hypothetical protein C1645_785176 [Glomus cerebriforme]|uniref:Uncharacterized protein n=1 Tax=Glomus cerebriforme TaxID=658196 RepID=A0A397SMY8_9GLOM|nr:hypothetical protein C1645_785176 [Glomus cerebriforme]
MYIEMKNGREASEIYNTINKEGRTRILFHLPFNASLRIILICTDIIIATTITICKTFSFQLRYSYSLKRLVYFFMIDYRHVLIIIRIVAKIFCCTHSIRLKI